MIRFSLLNTLILCLNIILILLGLLKEYDQSILMCTNFIYILWQAWRINKLSPYFLFITTFCFLFIGGHFWGNLFSPQLLSTRVGSFMDPTPSTDKEWNNTLIYILLFLYCSLLGYYKKYSTSNVISDNTVYIKNLLCNNKINQLLYILFYPLAFFVLHSQYKILLIVLGGGYDTLYFSQSGNYSSNSLLLVLFYFFFAMAMVYGDSKNKKLYLILIISDAILKVLGGGRGSLGSVLMFALWLYSTKNSINIKKLIVGTLVALISLLTISQMSKRMKDSDIKYAAINDVIGLFIYAQGESLSTFEKSRNFEYPALAYVQTFIPGSSFIYNKLFDSNLKNYETSFSLNLSRNLNVVLFENGDGVGWTLLSDIFLFSGRTWIFYIIISGILGYLLACLEIKSRTNSLYRVILFSIILRLMILPRTGLNYICPLIVYVYFFHFILNKCFNLKLQ